MRKSQLPLSNLFLQIKFYPKSWIWHKMRENKYHWVCLYHIKQFNLTISAKVHASSGKELFIYDFLYFQILVESFFFPFLFFCPLLLKLWFRPHIDTVSDNIFGVSATLSENRWRSWFEKSLIKTLGTKVWAGWTETTKGSVISRPSTSRKQSLAWRGEASDWLVALGFERAMSRPPW